MKKFKVTAKTSMGTPIPGTFDVEIDTDELLGEGDILTLEEELEIWNETKKN